MTPQALAFYEACVALRVDPLRVQRRTRKADIVRERDAVIARMYAQDGATLASVGEWFGLDHTTVYAAVRRQQRREATPSSPASPSPRQPLPAQ